MRKSILFAIAVLLGSIACTKVEEEAATIDTNGIDVDLVGLNNCDESFEFLSSSTFEIEIPVTNRDKVLVESIIAVKDGVEEEIKDFFYSGDDILFYSCYLFDGASTIESTFTLSGTNGVNERIYSEALTYSVERPNGAN